MGLGAMGAVAAVSLLESLLKGKCWHGACWLSTVLMMWHCRSVSPPTMADVWGQGVLAINQPD